MKSKLFLLSSLNDFHKTQIKWKWKEIIYLILHGFDMNFINYNF